MNRATRRLAELATRWDLEDAAVAQLHLVLQALRDEPTSITTVRDPDRAVDVHVADALVALDLPALRAAATIADLGAGGGFPGLALAAALPCARITLVESVGKKCAFLSRTAAAAGLDNVEVVASRAEAWRDGLGTQDAVTARALAPLNVLAEYAAPLLREGGALVAWKAGRDAVEEADGAAAAEAVGLAVGPVVAVVPFSDSGDRHLHLFEKVRPTPPRYPRREGIARKTPIRA